MHPQRFKIQRNTKEEEEVRLKKRDEDQKDACLFTAPLFLVDDDDPPSASFAFRLLKVDQVSRDEDRQV